jgi:hypothetical protein
MEADLPVAFLDRKLGEQAIEVIELRKARVEALRNACGAGHDASPSLT